MLICKFSIWHSKGGGPNCTLLLNYLQTVADLQIFNLAQQWGTKLLPNSFGGRTKSYLFFFTKLYQTLPFFLYQTLPNFTFFPLQNFTKLYLFSFTDSGTVCFFHPFPLHYCSSFLLIFIFFPCPLYFYTFILFSRAGQWALASHPESTRQCFTDEGQTNLSVELWDNHFAVFTFHP